MTPARKLYLDNIRWMTVVLVVIYHVVYLLKLPMDCYGDGEPQQTHQTGFGRSKKAWEKCTVTG